MIGSTGGLARMTLVRWQLPTSRPLRLGLLAAAAVGATLLVVVSTSWFTPRDETAYWDAAQRLLAGQSLYQPGAAPNQPYVYWYPPPLAQVLAPFTAFVPLGAYIAVFTIGLLGSLWWLSGRQPLVALAYVAFVPVAVELMTRNVHLILALLIVLALRRSPLFWIPAAALKVAPILGVLYLLLRRQWREAALVAVLGVVVLGVSVAASPSAWHDFVELVIVRGGSPGGDGLLPVPYALRLALGIGLVVLASRVAGVRGEAILVCGLTIANPTLWANAFSVLIAIVPLAAGWVGTRPRPMTPAGPSG